MATSAEIRQQFISFFEKHGHTAVASSSLVPANDPTLLFTNAGMVQFKDVFLGREQRNYSRAVSSQRCVRAGGKHNDLENVGYTARHHTFFEMLGNFSFGDYFKQDAIRFAWDFLTEEIKLPKEKLWVTVYQDDDEAVDIWLKEIGVDESRFTRIGDKPGGKRYESDNFWTMGDTGPCGPCTEIFYDHGEDVWGGPPGTPEEDGDRYIEIWNLVFMQYERDASGNMEPLPKPSVDTGMGLERLAAILQNGHSNYDIDLFQHLIKAASVLTDTQDLDNPSLKVIADHIRSCSFLITDGVMPSNEGRGYVLRRIIRRAARHGHKLGTSEPFFYQLVKTLAKEMGEAYPELVKGQAQIERVLKQEEEKFAETLADGMKILSADIAALKDKTISGETAFQLYDTYGFPVDLTADIAREQGLSVDMDGFESAMNEQRERSRSAGGFAGDYGTLDVEGVTEFVGYDEYETDANILALFQNGAAVEQLAAGSEGIVVLDRTPFYAESGGQVGDRGAFSGAAQACVNDTQKQGEVFLHHVTVNEGALSVGADVHAAIDVARRQATVLNHSATHLMHKALRDVLGDHVAQKGSLVNPDRLRFDFSHFEPMTAEQIAQVEDIVNTQIRDNSDTQARVMSMDDAMESGAMALFGEKYGDEVRVLNIGFSTELCGGCHVNRAGDIGVFKIVSEGGVAAGVRRIEAVTGSNALEWIAENTHKLDGVAHLLKANRDNVGEKVEQLVSKARQLEKELEQLKAKLSAQAGSDLVSQAIDINGIKVLAAKLEGVDPKSLRDTVDQLKDKLGQAAVVLATVSGDKVSLIAGVTKAETSKIKAGDLVNHVAQQVGGKGGGRPDMAQAGGNNPAALDTALQSVTPWLQEQL